MSVFATSKRAKDLMNILDGYFNYYLSEPDMAPNNDNTDVAMICFDNGEDHLEFEFVDGLIEVFYLKRSTNEMHEEYFDGTVSEKLKELLNLFVVKD